MFAVHGGRRSVAVRKEDGFFISTPDDGSKETVMDCVNCAHCNRIWPIGDAVNLIFKGEMGFCRKCQHPICPGEGCKECIPVERMLEIKEGANPTAVMQGGKFSGSVWVP